MNLGGKAKLLKIYIGEAMHHDGKSLYNTIVLKAKEMGLAGATVTRGIEGYGPKKKINTARILDLSADLPILVEIIDTADKIDKAIPVFKEMIPGGLMVVLDVEVLKYGNQG